MTMTHEQRWRNATFELSYSQEDWTVIRECYVMSFRRYPLYKYMVPDESKRDAFLRAYLQANYEVTVGSGQGILLAAKVPLENGDCCKNHKNKKSSTMKVVGGALFLPPSLNGQESAIDSDELYWKAYKKHGLAKICKEGFERLMRYEAWEDENFGKKATATGVPLWNGQFCAIFPEYASKGLGSVLYKEGLKILANYWLKQQSAKSKPARRQSSIVEENKFLTKFVRSISFDHSHCYKLLNHKMTPQVTPSPKRHDNEAKIFPSVSKRTPDVRPEDIMFNPDAPLAIAISHSERAANFHQSNGFHQVSRVPYYDEVEGFTPFYTHVLVLDPFRTGKLKKLADGLLNNEQPKQKSMSKCQLYNSLNTVNADHILVK